MTGKRRLVEPARPPAVRPTITRQAGRAELRRRRHRQRRILTAVVAVVVVLAGAAGAFLSLRGHPGRARAGSHTVSGRTQHTLLFQLQASNGSAAESALLADDSAAHTGVEVLLPAAVISEVPGAGSSAFGSALALPGGALLSRDALADLLGISVDSSWVVQETTFASLVDRLGGVRVNVDTTVTVPLKTGGATVLLNPGSQRVDGAQALAYATFVAAGQPPVTALPRLQGVLDGVMAALPGEPAQIAGLFTALGAGSQVSGQSPAEVAALLAGFKRDDAANTVSYATLPVTPIDTGGASLSYRIDPAGVHQLVSTQLAGSIPPGASTGHNRVLVENGVGTPGLGVSARDKLVKAGFQFVGSRNAPQFGHTQTVVLIFSATSQEQALGQRVARALGVNPTKAVRLSTIDQSIADVIVILGSDYRP